LFILKLAKEKQPKNYEVTVNITIKNKNKNDVLSGRITRRRT